MDEAKMSDHFAVRIRRGSCKWRMRHSLTFHASNVELCGLPQLIISESVRIVVTAVAGVVVFSE